MAGWVWDGPSVTHSELPSISTALPPHQSWCLPDPALTSTIFPDKAKSAECLCTLPVSEMVRSLCCRHGSALLVCGQENSCCGDSHILLLPCATSSWRGPVEELALQGQHQVGIQQMGPDGTFWRVPRAQTSSCTASRRLGSSFLFSLSFSSHTCVKILLPCSGGH